MICFERRWCTMPLVLPEPLSLAQNRDSLLNTINLRCSMCRSFPLKPSTQCIRSKIFHLSIMTGLIDQHNGNRIGMSFPTCFASQYRYVPHSEVLVPPKV